MPSESQLRAIGTLAKGAGAAYVEYEPKPPASDEILVESLYAGLEHIDIGQAATGTYIEQFPFFLGKAWSGRVLKVGSGVEDVKTGDLVAGVGYVQEAAGFRPQLTTRRAHVAKLPEGFSLQAAAGIPHAFATASWSLFNKDELNLPRSPFVDESKKPILIWGASTNVGIYAIQQLKGFGYTNVLAVASPKHFAFLKSIGAAQVFDRGSASVVDDINTAAGGAVVDGAVFTIDDQGWLHFLATLKQGSRFVYIIRNEPPKDKIPNGVWHKRSVVLKFPVDREIGDHALSAFLQDLLDQGQVQAKPGELFEGADLLETVQRAAKALRDSPGRDKIIVKVQ